MPIYEFYCPVNNKLYAFYAPSLAYADTLPRCPDDPALPLQRQVSRFSITSASSKAADEEEEGVMPDAGELAALEALEQEIGSEGEEDPDARQLAQALERYGERSGKPLSEPLREMLSRMREGESLESLEAEYAEVLEAADFQEVEGMLARRSVPERDPELYDMRDYL